MLGEDTRVLRFPVDAVDKPRDQVYVLFEEALVLLWVLVVVLLVELFCLVARARDVCRRENRDDDLPVVVSVLRVRKILAEL